MTDGQTDILQQHRLCYAQHHIRTVQISHTAMHFYCTVSQHKLISEREKHK